MKNDKMNSKDYLTINGTKICFEDVIREIRQTTGTTPLREGELYYKMDASVAQDDVSNYGATFFVKARNETGAIERARMFLLTSRDIDDTGFEIGWTTVKLYYKPESYEPEIEVIGEPLDETTFIEQKRQSWINYVADSQANHYCSDQTSASRSTMSEWKWPIIFIPIIIAILFALEYISSQ